jgi:hypothetical protein
MSKEPERRVVMVRWVAYYNAFLMGTDGERYNFRDFTMSSFHGRVKVGELVVLERDCEAPRGPLTRDYWKFIDGEV